MSDKRKQNKSGYVGQSGKTFNYTRDDLAANRAGFMTLPQQFGLNFSERRLFAWIFRIPPLNRIKPRAVHKVSGKIKKQYHSRIIYSGSGGHGGGHQDILEQRRIEVKSVEGVTTFFVNEKQFKALPENIDITIYYDSLDNRIVSIEPPYQI